LGNDTYTLNEGPNIIHLYVIPQNGTPVGHHTLEITRKEGPSQINTLSSIELQGGGTTLPNPVLTAPGSYSYETTVEFNVSKVRVTAVATDPKATVLGNDTYELDVGPNIIHLYVIPENETPVGYYTLIVFREPFEE